MGKLEMLTNPDEGDAAAATTSAIPLSSSDEEANRDLSLAIVERAMKRESNRKRAGNGDDVVVVLSDSDGAAVVANGTVDGGRKKRKKLRAMKKGERAGKVEKKEAPVVDAAPEEEETVAAVNSVVTDASDPVAPDVITGSDNKILRKLLRGPRYFDPSDKTQDACFNCGKEGHMAVDCTEEKRQKPCFVCGMFGHNAKRCTQGQECFICRRKGHIAKSCPDKHNDTSDSIICLRCGDLGHDLLSCNNDYPPEDLKGIQCYICKDYGHLCCADIIVGNAKEISCYNCAQPGHTGLGCAKLRGETKDFCFKCGEEGHFARGCTYNAKVSSETSDLCYKCGEGGHFARECTKRRKFDRSTPRKVTNDNKDSEGPRSVPSYFEKESKKFDDRCNKSTGKVRKNGGWSANDPGDFLRRKHKLNGWDSPSTPVGRNNFYSPASVDNYSSSRSPFKKHNSSNGTPRNHYGYENGYDTQRFYGSHGY